MTKPVVVKNSFGKRCVFYFNSQRLEGSDEIWVGLTCQPGPASNENPFNFLESSKQVLRSQLLSLGYTIEQWPPSGGSGGFPPT